MFRFANDFDRKMHEKLCAKKIQVSETIEEEIFDQQFFLNEVVVVPKATIILPTVEIHHPSHKKFRKICPKSVNLPYKQGKFPRKTRELGIQVNMPKKVLTKKRVAKKFVESKKSQQIATSTCFTSVETETSSYLSAVYDESACQTVNVETFGTGVQHSAAQMDIFCQTIMPVTQVGTYE